MSLATQAQVPDGLHRHFYLHTAVVQVLRSELSHAGLETCGEAVVEELDQPVDPHSVALAMSLYRTARWVASLLDKEPY